MGSTTWRSKSRGLIFLGFGLVGLGFGSAALPHETVNYRLTPEMKDGAVVALAVDMRFRGNPSGKTVLDLLDEWAGQAGRWKYLSDLNVKGAKVQIPKPSQRILLAPPRAMIRLSYRISSAYPDDPPASGGNPYDGAIIRPTWFASLGNFVFISVHGRADDWAKFAWGPTPKGWQVVSDLEPPPGAHMVADEIPNSVLMGGRDLKVTVRPVEGGVFRLAMRGKWLSGAPDDPSVPLSYLVNDNDGAERTISYLPIGKSSLQAQQVALTDFGQQHAEACRQFLSGDKAVHLLR